MRKPTVKYVKSKKSPKRIITKKSAKKPVSVKIKKYVKSVLARNIENKLAQPYTFNNTAILPYGVASPTLSTIIPLTSTLLQNITQGSGQGNRLGNEITVKNVSFKGSINRLLTSTGTNTGANEACYIKMVLLRNKVNFLQPSTMNDLMQNGNASTNPNNLPSDMYRYFNKDQYHIYTTRMFKLGSTISDQSVPTQQNNDFRVASFFRVNLTKHFPKKIKYTDGTPDPVNVAIYAVFLLCNYNGNVISSTAYPACEIHGDVSISYEDA